MESGNTDNRVIIEAKATFLAYTLGTTVINLIEQGKIKTKDDANIKYRELLDEHKKDPKYKIVFEVN